jgi:hypothetical protein
MKLSEIKPNIKYSKPNFAFEYNEVEQEFMKAASVGHEELIPNSKLDSIENHDDNWAIIEHDKASRAEVAFKAGKVELPILLKDAELLYLLAGNTRMAYARRIKQPVKAWIINTPGLKEHL